MTPSKAGRLALVMLGDVMLGRIVDQALSALGPEKQRVWGDTLPLLQGGMAAEGEEECQLVTGNLECAVTNATRKSPKEFNFKLSPANVDALKAAQFAFVSLANNHSLDYCEEGLVESMEVMRRSGIAFAGVGRAEEAAAPAVVERAGLRLAFLSYSDHYDYWKATSEQMGINFIDPGAYDRDMLAAQLRRAADQADVVVVFIHWGPNWRWSPSGAIRRLAHDFIDLGATAVFGHSSHHVQGVEVYGGRPIVYGAGGFLDDYALDEEYRNDLGFLYCLHLEGAVPQSLELVPTKITHEWTAPHAAGWGRAGGVPPYISYVNRAAGADRAWLASTVRRLSSEFGTQVHDAPLRHGLRIPLTA